MSNMLHDNPFFAIITPTYNSMEWFPFSFESIHSQSYRSFVHVIIDCESEDGIKEYLSAVDNSNFIFISEPDAGLYDALNKGINSSSSEVIGVLHSDDFYASPDVFLKIREAFNDPFVDFVYSDIVYVQRAHPEKNVRVWKPGEYGARKLYRGWMPPHTSIFMRRRLVEKVGLYDISFKISSDYDYILRSLRSLTAPPTYLSFTSVCMRNGGLSNLKRNFFLKFSEDVFVAKKNNIGGALVVLLKIFSKFPQFFFRF